tara:strand:- start:1008 stop:1214 length:207 start_codon:yes stop_codon:yes gene_type:complete
MELTTKDKAVLRALVEQELKVVTKEGEDITISNSPFLGMVIKDVPDLPFMKGEMKYKQFLDDLLIKLQ